MSFRFSIVKFHEEKVCFFSLTNKIFIDDVFNLA